MADDCDLCALDGQICPGQPVHCAHGQHCVATAASCAAEWAGGENHAGHPLNCEDCGEALKQTLAQRFQPPADPPPTMFGPNPTEGNNSG